MNSIIIIGNYGSKDRVDGQIMRTRTIYNSIKARYGNSYIIEKVDTSKRNILFYIRVCKKIVVAERIVILPAYGALKPLLFLINLFKASKKTVHIAVGGWLDKYINKQKWIKIENKFKAVLVQMSSLKKSLEIIGLNNVVYFPNYRDETNEVIKIGVKNSVYCKFVFYSRVILEKGIFEAIEAIQVLNKSGNDKYTLDIYGPVEESFKEILENKIKDIPNVTYHYPLEQGEILTTLNKYDALLFPTYYKGEGFPGAILEAFMAGVPVIASRWKFNEEIIEEGKTGLFCEHHSAESIIKCIKKLNNDLEKYRTMPLNCQKEAEKFSAEKVTKILFKTLDIKDEINEDEKSNN